jgi:Protein of unknown function (DUF3800)
MLTPIEKTGINAEYSPFEHMIHAIFLKASSLLVIIKPDPLTLYCDASGKESDPIFVVGGAISYVSKWLAFDDEWRQALRDEGLRYFRMSEFAHSTGEFSKGWKDKEKKRRDFLRRLVKIGTDHVEFWFGTALYNSDYQKADAVFCAREFLHPYPLCGISCVEIARRWILNNRVDYLPVEYVFESGDDHWDQLRKRMLADYKQEPIARAKEAASPLQVADFAAYEVGKAYRTIEQKDELFTDFRNSLGLLSVNIPHHWGRLTEVGIRSLLNLRSVRRR